MELRRTMVQFTVNFAMMKMITLYWHITFHGGTNENTDKKILQLSFHYLRITQTHLTQVQKLVGSYL